MGNLSCHENYLISRNVLLKHPSSQLLLFLVTRQLICGAGKLTIPAQAPRTRIRGRVWR